MFWIFFKLNSTQDDWFCLSSLFNISHGAYIGTSGFKECQKSVESTDSQEFEVMCEKILTWEN